MYKLQGGDIIYKIAIVEDEPKAADTLDAMLAQYAEENGVSIETSKYQNAVVFLSNYSARFDIIFMDIEMPHLSGMECAEKLREIDNSTLLIFATNLANMAAQGYSVDAFDFIVRHIYII